MVNRLRKMFKSEKGFTLVELLAVIVILGIIAAIAVPSIAGIIGGAKEDAQRANAMQMIEAARLAQASGLEFDQVDTGNQDGYTLDTLIDNGYLEEFDNPESNGGYDLEDSFVKINGNGFRVTLEDSSDKIVADIDNKTIKQLQEKNKETD